MFDKRPAMNSQSDQSKATATAPRVETEDGSKANLYLIRDKVQLMLLQDLDGPAQLGNTPEIQSVLPDDMGDLSLGAPSFSSPSPRKE